MYLTLPVSHHFIYLGAVILMSLFANTGWSVAITLTVLGGEICDSSPAPCCDCYCFLQHLRDYRCQLHNMEIQANI